MPMYGMKKTMENNNQKLIGFCSYCKDDIYEDGGYVFLKNKYYHLSCYSQIVNTEDILTEDIDINELFD